MAGALGGKGAEIKRFNWRLQNSHGNVEHSTGNVVDNVITTCGAGQGLDPAGGHFVSFYVSNHCAVHLKNNIK